MAVFVGVDWGCGAYALGVIDAEGLGLDRFEVGHDRAGLAALVTRLRKHGAPGVIPLAIERSSGLLVDALVAQILAELGDARTRSQTGGQLAAEPGSAPVTYLSGKSRAVGWRWVCNQRAALTCMAYTVYRCARGRGCNHPDAIRILARARAWTNHQPNAPARHASARLFLILATNTS